MATTGLRGDGPVRKLGRRSRDDAGPSPGLSGAAVERALRIVVLVISGIWLLLMAVFETDGASRAPLVTTAMLAALAVGWIVVVVRHLPVNGWFVLAVAATGMVQIHIAELQGLWTDAGLLVTWTNVAALSAGFALVGRRGRISVVAIAAVELLMLASRAWKADLLGVAWPAVVATAAYVLVDGMAAHIAATAVRAQARETDEAAHELALGRRGTAAREAAMRETERVSRVLHDTVLNTLGAIRRGVDPADVGAVRARCARDLSELRDLRDLRFGATGDTGITADALLASLASRAAVLALHVDVRSRVSTSAPIPTIVGDAVYGGCAEALLNVSKHAGTRTAALELSWDGTALDVRVHDDGVGWSGELLPEHGIARSILGRAREAGIEAVVATDHAAGTSVMLSWRDPASSAGDPSADSGIRRRLAAAEPAATDRDIARTLARVAVVAGSWVTGLMAFLTAVFWSTTPQATSLLALAVLGGVLLLSWWVGVRRGDLPMRPALAALLVVATFVVTALPARSAATCVELTEGWWGLDGGIVVLLCLALLTRGWWWTALGCAAMVAGALSLYLRDTPLPGDCAGVPVVNAALEVAIVVAIVIFRESLLRLWNRASAVREHADRLRVDEDVTEATERVRHARLDGVLAATVPLLDLLASGQVDPVDPVVMHRCATAESALRALLTIGPTLDRLGDLLGEAVLHAYTTGRTLQVMPSFGTARLPRDSADEPLRALLREVVDRMPEGSAMTAALITGPEGSTLTLVADGPFAPLPVEMGRSLHRAGLALDQAQTGEQTLVEVRWT